MACNDFGPVAAECIPPLDDALAALREHGAEITLLSGSGGAVFGVFANAGHRDAASARAGIAGTRRVVGEDTRGNAGAAG